MQQNLGQNRAWIKVAVNQSTINQHYQSSSSSAQPAYTYKQVIILSRISQNRSLVIDEKIVTNNSSRVGSSTYKEAYFVNNEQLIKQNPNKHRNTAINEPLPQTSISQQEFETYLKQLLINHDIGMPITNQGNNTKSQKGVHRKQMIQSRRMYTLINNNFLITKITEQIYQSQNSADHLPLQQFFQTHIRVLLSDYQEKQRSLVILSTSSTSIHLSISKFFSALALSQQVWPHKVKIQNLSQIFKIVFPLSDISLRLKFLNHHYNSKESHQTISLQIKPFQLYEIPETLRFLDKLFKVCNNKQFHDLYKGPTPSGIESPSSELHRFIQLFLTLGIEVQSIHSIMRLVSMIINFDRIQVELIKKISTQKQDYQSNEAQYEIRLIQNKQTYQSLHNLEELIQMPMQGLAKVILIGQTNELLKDGQFSYTLEQNEDHGSFYETVIMRLNIIKLNLYEMLQIKICEIINNKLQHLDINTIIDANAKLRYGPSPVHTNKDERQRILNIYFSRNQQLINKQIEMKRYKTDQVNPMDRIRKQLLRNKLNLMKGCITQSLLPFGSDYQQKDNRLELINQKTGKNLKHLLVYRCLIQMERKKVGRELGQSDLWDKQKLAVIDRELSFAQMYQQMSHYFLFSNICYKLFNTYQFEKSLLISYPSIFYFLYFLNNNQTDENKYHFSTVVDYGILISDQLLMKRIIQILRKDKTKPSLAEQEGKQIEKKSIIIMKIEEFVDRYIYTKFFKEKIIQKQRNHEYGSLKGQKKQVLIGLASPYHDNQSASVYYAKKLIEYIKRERPSQLKIKVEASISSSGFNRKQAYFVEVKNKEFFKGLQEEVIIRYRMMKKIEKFYLHYQARKSTLLLVKSIYRQRNMQRTLRKLCIRHGWGYLTKCGSYQQLKNQQPIQNKIEKSSENTDNLLGTYSPQFIIKAPQKSNQKTESKVQQSIHIGDNIKLSDSNIPEAQMVDRNIPEVLPLQVSIQAPKINAPQLQIIEDEQLAYSRTQQKSFSNLEIIPTPKFWHKYENSSLQEFQCSIDLKELEQFYDQTQFSFSDWFSTSRRKIYFVFQNSLKKTPLQKIQTVYLYEKYQLKLDKAVLENCMYEDYLSFAQKNFGFSSSNQLQVMLSQQSNLIHKPYLKLFPLSQYPTFSKESFNAILKIGLEKNTTKKLNDLLNTFVVPIYQCYYSQKNEERSSLFNEQQIIPLGYQSKYNILKDEIFIYFAKQIGPFKQGFSGKYINAYLYGLSLFTRYFSPSPMLIYQYTHYLSFILKKYTQRGEEYKTLQLLTSVLENLFIFIQAFEGSKKNNVNVFQKSYFSSSNIKASQIQYLGYLWPRQSPIVELQYQLQNINEKPPTLSIHIYTLSNQTFNIPIKNQIVKTVKKRLASYFGFDQCQQYFSFAVKTSTSFQVINDKQKALTLLNYKKQQRIYLIMNSYIPFAFDQQQIKRFYYLNMVFLDQQKYPWTPQQYEYLVYLSVKSSELIEERTIFYANLCRSRGVKGLQLEQIKKKYRNGQSSQRIEDEYINYLVKMDYFGMKIFSILGQANVLMGIQPLSLNFYKESHLVTRVKLQCIRRIELYKDSIHITLQLGNPFSKQKKGSKRSNLSKRKVRLLEIKVESCNLRLVYKTLLLYSENRMK